MHKPISSCHNNHWQRPNTLENKIQKIITYDGKFEKEEKNEETDDWDEHEDTEITQVRQVKTEK